MKPKTVVLLAVAVGSGLLAMIGVQQAMSGGQTQLEEKVKVLVALTDLDIGVPLAETNVEFRDIARSAVTFDDPILTVEQYEKRSPLFALKAGDIIRKSKLSEQGISGKSQQIDKGMRVLVIPVDDTGSFSGLLQAGDRVDVMVTYNYRDQRARQQTKTTTLLEYVEVFATDDKTAREGGASANDGKNKTRTVALLLAPEHVPFVKLAESKGKLALAWRRRDDDELASVGPINEELLDELRGLDAMGGRGGYGRAYGAYDEGGFPTGESEYGSPASSTTNTDTPGNLDASLTEAEGTNPPQQIAIAPEVISKPMWKVQIYTGNDVMDQEFELPDPPKPEPEVQETQASQDGARLWNLFKQAL